MADLLADVGVRDSKAPETGHILRGAASAARVGELNTADDPAVGDMLIEQARRRATPIVIDVLSRYPLAPASKNRVARLMSALDVSLRASR